MYRFTLEEQLLPDYDVVSWYLCTHEKSMFTRDLMVARCTSWGRYSLFNNRLSTYHLDGTSDKKFLSSVAQLKEVLEVVFLIDLPRHKELDRKLGTLLKEK
jgi:N-hydroxyarylamine O-acetyltransferase